MPVEVDPGEDVKILIQDIISKNHWELISEVNYYRGSESGDGYASRTIAADVPTKQGVIKLFLKCMLNIKGLEAVKIDMIYKNEIYFYEEVYPTFQRFLEKKYIEDGFRNAPKFYGSSKENIVVLENLRAKGFTLCDRRKIMNAAHIELALRTFAKFHAISFAFKDQKKEECQKLAQNTFDYFSSQGPEFAVMFKKMINDFLIKLDPINDKHILDKCDPDNLIEILMSPTKNLNEYSIITQGDCWSNNMMFLYEKEDKEEPSDIMLVDWQITREASPIFDVSYFFFSTASAASLSKLDYYLKVYYKELSKRIKQLGSDPDIVYPFEIFETEWRQYCKYGFVMAIMLVKIMLCSQDEIFNFEKIDLENLENLDLYPKFDMEAEYVKRIKMIAEFVINNNYL